MDFVRYIAVVSFCLALFYISYIAISGKSMNFRHARFYLLASIVISLLIPLSDYSMDTGFTWPGKDKGTILIYGESTGNADNMVVSNELNLWERIIKTDPLLMAFWVSLSITTLFLLRIVLMLALLSYRYINGFKVHMTDCVLIYNHGFSNTFSFFRWIFIHPETVSDEDLEQIIAHEKIHVSQFHSFDIILIELLTAVMWFNPFVWMIKNSLRLVHEYLADDGALDTGINRFKYQALLINQIAEERLVVLSSSFNNSLIKKRITMMTQSKIQRRSLLKLLAVVPVATLLFLFMAVFNGMFSENAQASASSAFSMVSPANSILSVPSTFPPDTIIKKTIIKKISKENPNDTIIEEKEEIITGEDAIHESHIIRHDGDGQSHVIIIDDDGDVVRHRDGERREVRVNVENSDERHRERSRESGYSVHVVDGDAVIEEINETGDSVRHVKIITRRGGEKLDLSKDKKVIIRHSGEPVHSEILYVVDGVNHTDKEFINTINSDNIERMDVVKGDAIKKYTDKDYEGVIVITTKKGKKK